MNKSPEILPPESKNESTVWWETFLTWLESENETAYTKLINGRLDRRTFLYYSFIFGISAAAAGIGFALGSQPSPDTRVSDIRNTARYSSGAKAIPSRTATPSSTSSPTAAPRATSTQTATPSQTPSPAPTERISEENRSAIALRAAKEAVASMPGPYSWDEYRQCSTYVSAYMRALGFSIDGPNDGPPAGDTEPFPWSSVILQVKWLRRNYPQFTNDADLIDLLEGRLWDRIKPGDVIYLTTAINHNGYDDYYHTVVLVGYHTDGSPQFAELAFGMQNASAERSFDQMTSFYKRNSAGVWDVTPSNPNNTLQVTWFDPLAILNQESE